MRQTKQSSSPGPFVGKTGGSGPPPDLTPYLKHAGAPDLLDAQTYRQDELLVDAAPGSVSFNIPAMTVGGYTIGPGVTAAYPGLVWRTAANDIVRAGGFDLNPGNPNGYGVALFVATDDGTEPNGSQGFLFSTGNTVAGTGWQNLLFMSPEFGYQFFQLPNAEVLGTGPDGQLVARDGITQNFFTLDTTPETISTDVGTFIWNDTEKTADLILPDGITLQIGQETQLVALNNTGSTILNGKLVYVSGATGNRVTIALADADGSGQDGVIGMTTQDIANNQSGKVTLLGLVRDIDTSAFAAGAPLYLSTTPGALTATPPAFPAAVFLVGYVSRSHAVNGSVLIYVRNLPQNTQIASPFGQELYSYATSETDGAIGQNGTLNANPSNGTRGFAFIPNGSVQINRMRIQITQITGSNMRLGIYDASGNRLAQTNRFSPVLGINTASLTSSVTLAGGTLYYMAYWTDDATANVRFKLLSGRSVGTAQPLDQRSDPNEMPVSIGSGMTNTQFRPWLQISG